MEEFRKLLADWMNDFGAAENVDDTDDELNAEWANNAISRDTVFNFAYGYFGKNKTAISHEEINLCRRLAMEAKKIFGNEAIGLGSEGGESMEPFWLVATKEDTPEIPEKITPELIRHRFEGTIFPPMKISKCFGVEK